MILSAIDWIPILFPFLGITPPYDQVGRVVIPNEKQKLLDSRKLQFNALCSTPEGYSSE